ncbi:restriction endonuclease subunit S [Enterobacter mori]|uniref:restriction endonuclease subunit S n=1 Tax=Enterobacter mori TaxID=539813 RepID=UPI0021B0977D|nr:restriction endonuclease subunit S [Enterobacter mori]UWX93842.1 restriction endonuclease subunit S [Enterobacter mori]
MAKYKAYPEYKYSGVEWLGMIPTEWKISHFKWLTNDGKAFASGPFGSSIGSKFYQECGVPVIRGNNLSINGEKPFFKDSGYVYLDDAKANELSNAEVIAGDLVFTARGTVGQVGLIPTDNSLSWSRAILSANQLRFRSDSEKNNSNYLWYQFSSWFIRTQITLSSDSVAQPNLNLGSLKSLNIIIPPLSVQKTIANFLEHETAKIDNLIENQKKLIELLNEKRQAVISHAVTKGLNPDVPMKNSGVEWLGKVPEHWVVCAIKHIVSTPITDGPHETPDFIDDGIPFISAEAISSGFIDFDKKRACISIRDHKRFSKKYSPQFNDIYMVKSGATTGITAIVETYDDFNIWSPLAVIRCNEYSNPYFVINFLRSKQFQTAIELNWSYGTQQNIGMGVIGNLHIARPPVSEAIDIADYLRAKCAKLDELINISIRQISIMQERRIALISAAVTGKIDVRDWVAPDTQDVEEPLEATA